MRHPPSNQSQGDRAASALIARPEGIAPPSMLSVLNFGLALVGHAPTPGRAPARAGVTMKATPKVPYKHRESEFTQWVDIYNRMYRERIMFLSEPIGDDFANTIIAVLLFLESEDANKDVSMYFNVPGGQTKAGLALHDTMVNMPYDIQTVNMGLAAQTSAFLIAGGTPGKRFALPNSRFYMMVRRLPCLFAPAPRRPLGPSALTLRRRPARRTRV